MTPETIPPPCRHLLPVAEFLASEKSVHVVGCEVIRDIKAGDDVCLLLDGDFLAEEIKARFPESQLNISETWVACPECWQSLCAKTDRRVAAAATPVLPAFALPLSKASRLILIGAVLLLIALIAVILATLKSGQMRWHH